jgi:DNA-binding transcriptional MerR regulator
MSFDRRQPGKGDSDVDGAISGRGASRLVGSPQPHFLIFGLTLELVPAFIITIITKVGKNSLKNESYRPGQLARITGVSADTLRHYERKGLLKSRRSPNGYREYPHHSVDSVTLIRNALAIGFGLDDLAQILKIRDAGGAPCRKVHAMATAKLDELETLLREITKLRDGLRRLLKDWNRRLESTDNNEPARLLESITIENLGGGQIRLPVNSLLRKRKLHKEKK